MLRRQGKTLVSTQIIDSVIKYPHTKIKAVVTQNYFLLVSTVSIKMVMCLIKTVLFTSTSGFIITKSTRWKFGNGIMKGIIIVM